MDSMNGSHAKNVILLISDGADMNTWYGASYYRFGELGLEAYDAFDVKRFMTTNPLTFSATPTFTKKDAIGYDLEQAWSTKPVEGTYAGSYPRYFAGYDYQRADYTDSAAAGTALASGIQTYNNAIDFDNFGEPVPHIGELVVESGRALGIVSSVYWTHATPAAFGAKNASRNDYVGIAREMVERKPLRNALPLVPDADSLGPVRRSWRRGWASGGLVRAALRRRCCRRVPGRTVGWSASWA